MRYPFFVALIATALLSSTLCAAEEPPPRVINTTGESTVYVKPDEVVINLGVETFNKVLSEAKSANDSMSKTLVQKIHDAGVDSKYVKTDVMQVEIIYPEGGIRNGIAGYCCRRA